MKEAQSSYLAINITERERAMLELLAEKNGATLTGTVRRAIRSLANLEVIPSAEIEKRVREREQEMEAT